MAIPHSGSGLLMRLQSIHAEQVKLSHTVTRPGGSPLVVMSCTHTCRRTISSCRSGMLIEQHTPVESTLKHNSSVEADVCAFAVADDLLLINDISVDESEDLPKILGPLVEEGPLAGQGSSAGGCCIQPCHQQAPAASDYEAGSTSHCEATGASFVKMYIIKLP